MTWNHEFGSLLDNPKENVWPYIRDFQLKCTWVMPSQRPDWNPTDLKQAVHARKPSSLAELKQRRRVSQQSSTDWLPVIAWLQWLGGASCYLVWRAITFSQRCKGGRIKWLLISVNLTASGPVQPIVLCSSAVLQILVLVHPPVQTDGTSVRYTDSFHTLFVSTDTTHTHTHNICLAP